jgi:hypothetical protein
VGRDLEIGEESELTLKEALQRFTTEESAFALGDVSFHADWTFRRAGANTSTRPREVMTMIYIYTDEKDRVIQPQNKNQGMLHFAAWRSPAIHTNTSAGRRMPVASMRNPPGNDGPASTHPAPVTSPVLNLPSYPFSSCGRSGISLPCTPRVGPPML